jgi:hypothetical protein
MIREVLRVGKGFKPVGGHVLLHGQELEKVSMDPYRAAGKALKAVLDAFDPYLEIPAHIDEPRGGDKLAEKNFVVDDFLCVVIDGEGLGREGPVTALAAEAGHSTEGFGRVISVVDIPVVVVWCLKIGTSVIWAMGDLHGYSL